MATRAGAVLLEDPPVAAVTLSGSWAHGDADAWSDIDLHVYVTDGWEQHCWDRRFSVFATLGTPLFVADIPDLVPFSVIAYYPAERLQLTYLPATQFPGRPVGEIVLGLSGNAATSSERRSAAVAHQAATASPTVDPYGPTRFAFWLTRVWVAAERHDTLQWADSVLRMTEIYLALVAGRRGRRFFGLRKTASYLTPDELAFVDGIVGSLQHRDAAVVTELIRRWDSLLAGTDTTTSDGDVRSVRKYVAMVRSRLDSGGTGQGAHFRGGQ